MKFINSSKNKMNSEIIYNFNPHPNAQVVNPNIITQIHTIAFSINNSKSYLSLLKSIEGNRKL